jgi:hypothetical protein
MAFSLPPQSPAPRSHPPCTPRRIRGTPLLVPPWTLLPACRPPGRCRPLWIPRSTSPGQIPRIPRSRLREPPALTIPGRPAPLNHPRQPDLPTRNQRRTPPGPPIRPRTSPRGTTVTGAPSGGRETNGTIGIPGPLSPRTWRVRLVCPPVPRRARQGQMRRDRARPQDLLRMLTPARHPSRERRSTRTARMSPGRSLPARLARRRPEPRFPRGSMRVRKRKAPQPRAQRSVKVPLPPRPLLRIPRPHPSPRCLPVGPHPPQDLDPCPPVLSTRSPAPVGRHPPQDLDPCPPVLSTRSPAPVGRHPPQVLPRRERPWHRHPDSHLLPRQGGPWISRRFSPGLRALMTPRRERGALRLPSRTLRSG